MKILLATDGSEYSELAIRFLACLNLSADDEITVFHTVYRYPLYYKGEFYYETLKDINQEIAPKILETALNILKRVKAKISTAIDEGSPEQCILDTADSSDMDLIIMGARGIKGLKSLFIGSVTRSIAHNSSKPLLVIKPPGCGVVGRLKILFATDGSDNAVNTGVLLSGIPFPDNTELKILNVISLPFSLNIPETYYPGINARIADIEMQMREIEFRNSKRTIEQAQLCLSESFKKIEVQTEVGDPSTEILRVSEISTSDIIAVGCRGLGGIKGIMGSVSRNVLTHAKCSVLIGRTCKN